MVTEGPGAGRADMMVVVPMQLKGSVERTIEAEGKPLNGQAFIY